MLGVSRDTPDDLKAFKENNSLKYPLLSDPTGEFAKALGVVPGQRETVIVGKDGKIERVYTAVTAATHPQELLKDLGHAEAKK